MACAYRFAVGARVKCNVGKWEPGTVVALDYREEDWPIDGAAPYQVQLDSGSLIYAPEDNDRYIKSLSAPADVDQILARERAGWVEQEDMPPDDSSEPSMSWEDIKNWDKPPNYPPPRPANWVPPDDEEPYRKRDWAQEPTAAEWGTGTEGSAHGKRFEIGGVEMVNAHHPDGTRGFVTAPEFARLEQLRVTTPSYDAEVRARIHWDGPREECRCYICLLEADCEQEEEEEGGMLCVGVSVRVHSLSSGPGHHLNGLVGVVVGYVQTSGRWRVKLPDGVKKNLKPANLTRCAATTAAASSSSAPAAAPARGRRGRGSGGKNPNGNTGRGGHGQQQQHVKQETGQEQQPGRVKLVPPPDVSFSEMLAKPGAIEMLKGHIGISPDRDIPLQILQQMESDYNEQQRLAAAAGSDTASSADLDEISSESDDESDLPSRLSRGWQPASIVEMDPQAWMVQRGLDCFFYGFGNTYGSLRKAGLTDAEIICSVPDCTGKRALSERNVEWCAKANGRKTSLRYMTLAPEKAKQAAVAAGAKGWRSGPRGSSVSLVCEGCFAQMMADANVPDIRGGPDCRVELDAHTLRCIPGLTGSIECTAGGFVDDQCLRAHEARAVFHKAVRASLAQSADAAEAFAESQRAAEKRAERQSS